MLGRFLPIAALACATSMCPGPARAEALLQARRASDLEPRTVGVGIKRGAGFGNSPGAEIIWSPHHLVCFDVSGFYLADLGEDGVGASVAAQLNSPVALRRLLPYLAVGFKVLRREVGGDAANATGAFGTIGSEWITSFGLGIRMGVGLHGSSQLEVSDGLVTTRRPGVVGFMAELGLRYWF